MIRMCSPLYDQEWFAQVTDQAIQETLSFQMIGPEEVAPGPKQLRLSQKIEYSGML